MYILYVLYCTYVRYITFAAVPYVFPTLYILYSMSLIHVKSTVNPAERLQPKLTAATSAENFGAVSLSAGKNAVCRNLFTAQHLRFRSGAPEFTIFLVLFH